MEAWKITYCMSVSVQTISNMSFGRSMHWTFTIVYPFSLHLSIDTNILLSSSSTSFTPIDENEGLVAPDGLSKSRLANMSWWSLRSVWLIELLHPRNRVLTPLWSLSEKMLEGWRTVERWSSMVASLLGSSMEVKVDSSETYATQARHMLWLQAWASTMLHLCSARTAEISEKRPGLLIPIISMAVWSLEGPFFIVFLSKFASVGFWRPLRTSMAYKKMFWASWQLEEIQGFGGKRKNVNKDPFNKSK